MAKEMNTYIYIYISCQFHQILLIMQGAIRMGNLSRMCHFFFFFNAFLSIFTICLLRPPNMYPHHLGKEKRIRKRSKAGVIQFLTSTKLITLNRQVAIHKSRNRSLHVHSQTYNAGKSSPYYSHSHSRLRLRQLNQDRMVVQKTR